MTGMTGTAAAGRTAPILAGEPAERPLWRNRDYRLLATGSAGSWTGIAMADVVYPLLILGFTGSPMLAAVFGVIQFAAMILGSLPAGAFIDRHDRRRILIGAETARAAAGVSLALAIGTGHLWLAQLFLVAAVLGVCQPFSGVRTILLRATVSEAGLSRALARQQVVAAAAALAGPAIGTALYAAGRSLPFAVSAAALALSAVTALLLRYRPTGEPGTAARGAVADEEPSAPATAADATDGGALAGLRILWNRPLMRSAMLIIMMVNLVGVPLDLVLIVQARGEGVPTHYIGLILAAFAGGAILGAPLIPRLHRLLRPGWLLIDFVGLVSLTVGLLAVPLGGFWMAGLIAVVGLAMPALQVLVQVLILQQVPDGQRGRVMSAAVMLMSLGMPLGSALGGLLLQVFGPTGAILFLAAVTGVSTLLAVSQRSLRRAAWPEPASAA